MRVATKELTIDDAVRGATRPRVVAILPRGEAIKNFVYSGALERLSALAEVMPLTVVPNEAIYGGIREAFPLTRPLEEIRERAPVGYLRALLDVAHGRWLWSAAARERWRRRDFEAREGSSTGKRALSKALALPFANRAGLRALSAAERYASRALRTTDSYLAMYRELRPSLVFNCSHVHSANAVQAVQAAQWLGIPTATFVFSWDNLTSQGRILLPYDHYFVWTDDIKEQFLSMYDRVRPEQVHVTGTPQFDFHFRQELLWDRDEFCARVGADPSRPIVLYSTGMANHMPGEEVIVERIADTLARSPELRNAQLAVRLYAKDRTGRFDELRSRRRDIVFLPVEWEPNWLTPAPGDAQLLTNALEHCDVGINVASTISLELCIFDKPVVNVGYNPPGVDVAPIDYAIYYGFDHYKPLVERGAVDVAYSEEELRTLVAAALADPRAGSARRRRFLEGWFGGMLDGRASERIVGEIARIVREGRP